MSNSKKAIKNGIYGSFSQIFIFALKFFKRRFFVLYLSLEFLGIESLFGNLFTLFNVSELGISLIICYQLYKAFANDDKDEINKLMSIYKVFYFIIGTFILIIGILSNFFLPFIISNQTVSFDYLHKIYFLMLVNTVCSYFLSYRTTLYIASQNEYICNQINVIIETTFTIIELFVIYFYRNFILYLMFDILKSVILNLTIYLYAKRIFPFLNDTNRIKLQDIRERKIFFDIKNILYGKMAGAIYYGTDSILISKIFGISFVAIYSNYFLIYSSLRNISFNKYVSAINPAIANFLNKNKDFKNRDDMLKRVDLFNHCLAMFFSIGFLLFSQTFIFYWLGKESLFNFSTVVVYCIYIYVEISFEVFATFRSVYGDFDFDKKYFMYAAIFNIVFSIIFSYMLGIAGIILGTIVGFLFIAYGRAKFVYYKVVKFDIKNYWIKHTKMILQYFIILLVTIFLSLLLDYSILHILFRVIYFAFVILLYIIISSIFSRDFCELKSFLFNILLQYKKVRHIYEKFSKRNMTKNNS